MKNVRKFLLLFCAIIFISLCVGCSDKDTKCSIPHNQEFSLNFEDEEGITNIIKKCSQLFQHDNFISMNDAERFLREMIDGPLHKIEWRFADFHELNPSHRPGNKTRTVGCVHKDSFALTYPMYHIKILCKISIGFKINIFFHEVGHLHSQHRRAAVVLR